MGAERDEYECVEFWIHQIETLDRVLEKPAVSLVHLLNDAITNGDKRHRHFTVRTRITREPEQPFVPSLLIHAVACSAVLRLWEERRRFPWLERSAGKELKHLRTALAGKFTSHPALRRPDALGQAKCLDDLLFGTMSPITAAEVFWVLIRTGEAHAHTETGFLALFAILWALKRRTHGAFEAGAALGRWRPTVAITARCVLPILKLNEILTERANAYRKVAEICGELQSNEQGENQYQRWTCAAAMDRLSIALHELGRVSVVPSDFEEAGHRITDIASALGPDSETLPRVREVRAEVLAALRKLCIANDAILSRARRATDTIVPGIIELLEKPSAEVQATLLGRWKLEPQWETQKVAAKEANGVCKKALRRLQDAVKLLRKLPEKEVSHQRLVATLEQLAAINEDVRMMLAEAIEPNVDWCVRTMPREIAYASAGNETKFDAAELLSGVEIAEWDARISRAEVADSIRYAFHVVRSDGSWATGQPVFLEKRYLGVWPNTPDLVLLLASVVRPHEQLHDADVHLQKYVQWLDAHLTSVRPKEEWDGPELWGWQSETREDGIDIWSTATAIKGLLEIREIFEDRLWQVCSERFTILSDRPALHTLDPVDLGAIHKHRLHRRLMSMASETQHHPNRAEYGFVMHGPPGSSKSAVAEAIGNDAWRRRPETRMPSRKPRIVRITPADFTRRGQEGLDVEARFIFRLLSHVRRVTILFDEIDDLLRNRAVGVDPTFIRLVIPGMLNRLQDLRDVAPKQEICFLLATNYIDQIEPALTRPGRLDGALPVPYPDPWSRECIIERVAAKEDATVSDAVKTLVVAKTTEWPWTTYHKLCKRLCVKGEPPTVAKATKELTRFATQLQSPDEYYRNRKRWAAKSPLGKELVHFAFSVAKNRDECSARVAKILGKDRAQGLGVLKLLEAEWARQRRP